MNRIEGTDEQRHYVGHCIRAGLTDPKAREDRDGWLYTNDQDGKVHCCGLGLAAIGAMGSAKAALDEMKIRSGDPITELAGMIGIPRRLAWQIEDLHHNKRLSAAQIAEELLGTSTVTSEIESDTELEEGVFDFTGASLGSGDESRILAGIG